MKNPLCATVARSIRNHLNEMKIHIRHAFLQEFVSFQFSYFLFASLFLFSISASFVFSLCLFSAAYTNLHRDGERRQQTMGKSNGKESKMSQTEFSRGADRIANKKFNARQMTSSHAFSPPINFLIRSGNMHIIYIGGCLSERKSVAGNNQMNLLFRSLQTQSKFVRQQLFSEEKFSRRLTKCKWGE